MAKRRRIRLRDSWAKQIQCLPKRSWSLSLLPETWIGLALGTQWTCQKGLGLASSLGLQESVEISWALAVECLALQRRRKVQSTPQTRTWSPTDSPRNGKDIFEGLAVPEGSKKWAHSIRSKYLVWAQP